MEKATVKKTITQAGPAFLASILVFFTLIFQNAFKMQPRPKALIVFFSFLFVLMLAGAIFFMIIAKKVLNKN